MNSLPSQTALDIHVFVNDHSIPCSIIALNSPAPGVVAYEPRALRFLERVAGFHTGNLPEMYLGRFIPLYNALVMLVARFLNDLRGVFNHVCITDAMDTEYHVFEIDAIHHRHFYALYGIYPEYPFQNLLFRLHTLIRAVQKYQQPRLQTTTITTLPTELLVDIIRMLDNHTVNQLYSTCRKFRELCLLRRANNAYFVIRYNHDATHNPPHARWFIATIVESMIKARSRSVLSMRSFLQQPTYRTAVRRLHFDNEWERMYPLLMDLKPPAPVDSEIFEPLYATIVHTITFLRITHIRMTSLALTSRLLQHFANHPTLRSLAIDGCVPLLFPVGVAIARMAPRMRNIQSLQIGLPAKLRAHRKQWMLVALCSSLRQLYVYAANHSAVHYPQQHRCLQNLHKLERLHIQGSCTFVLDFIYLLGCAGEADATSSPLAFFKLHAALGIMLPDAELLVATLATHFDGLRVLVLEGIDSVPSSLFDQIGLALPFLEGLTIIRRANESQCKNKLCIWDEPIYDYAFALRYFPMLRHLGTNFYWTPRTYSPRTLDTLIAADSSSQSAQFDEHAYARAYDDPQIYFSSIMADIENEDRMDDGPSMAIAFAANCPTLESFVIRADTIFFSCSIRRDFTGAIVFDDVFNAETSTGFEYWNPMPGKTWSD